MASDLPTFDYYPSSTNFLTLYVSFSLSLVPVQVSVFSENGTTYFYNPDETLPSQLSTGQVR